MAPAFLTSPRNIAPVISRMRFEAIDNLRVNGTWITTQSAGNIDANNLFAGYSFGRTTLGIGHALLNAVDEDGSNNGTSTDHQKPAIAALSRVWQAERQRIQPGREWRLRLCAAPGAIWRRAGGLQLGLLRPYLGYRRFELGTVGSTSRDETQWLYSFTLANFGAVGDIRRTNSVFRDPTLPPAY